MIEIERIVGALFSGIACKVYAGALGVWIAYEAAQALHAPLSVAAKILGR